MYDLSICIPTYNRPYYLDNCLNSIKLAKKEASLSLEVCISDNCSSEKIEPILEKYKKDINIIFNKNEENIGMGKNILKATSIARGKFCWLLGDDDLLLPNSLKKISNLFKKFEDVDFYYVNSFHLKSEKLINHNHPVNTQEINTNDLKKFSNFEKSYKLNFFELIDPKKSFEFMLSFFLCIFKREHWEKNVNIINEKNINDYNKYTNLDNTAPHIKIWAKGFKNKNAYFCSEPLTINVHGPRAKDWGHLWAFVEGVTIPQVVDNYRREGLPFVQYLKCKNYALRRLIPSFFHMIKNRKNSNFKYVCLKKDLLYNLMYPMVYLSVIILSFKKIIFLIKKYL